MTIYQIICFSTILCSLIACNLNKGKNNIHLTDIREVETATKFVDGKDSLLYIISSNFNEVRNSTNGKISVVNSMTSPFNNINIQVGINEFIQYISDLGFDNSNSRMLYIICFYEKEDTTYIDMYIQPFYLKEYIIGYTYIDNHTFAYYGSPDIGRNYIDSTKLYTYKDTLPGFVDYSNFPAGHYEPYGIRYKIMNSDSLVVVRKGMF